MRDKDGKFYIGNKEAKIKENKIIVGHKEYVGTPGLWELIATTTSRDKIFSNGDLDNYAEIMHSTKALKVNEVIAKYVDTSAINLNKLIDGSSVNSPSVSNAIAIQDLVKRLHGSGLKVT